MGRTKSQLSSDQKQSAMRRELSRIRSSLGMSRHSDSVALSHAQLAAREALIREKGKTWFRRLNRTEQRYEIGRRVRLDREARVAQALAQFDDDE